MKRILFILMTLVALSAAAQGVPTWLEEVHNFGTFRSDLKRVTCVMKVVNTGDSAMMITRVRPNCGCTVAEYTRAVMQPGDTGSVTITYSARDIPGTFEKEVLVYTTGVPHKSLLTIKGNVVGTPEAVANRYPNPVGPVRLSSTILSLEEVKRMGSKNTYISGYNTSSDTMVVTVDGYDKETSHPHVVPDTIEPGGLFIISDYYMAGSSALWGLNIDTIKVHARPLHGGEGGDGAFQVYANVKENFDKMTDKQRKDAPLATISTDKVNFESVSSTEPVSLTFTISNTGKNDLKIRRLYVPEGKHVTVTSDKDTVKKGKTATITVALDAPACSNSVLNTTLEVITNDPITPITTLRLVGMIK